MMDTIKRGYVWLFFKIELTALMCNICDMKKIVKMQDVNNYLIYILKRIYKYI